MIILGIAFLSDASACVLRDGEIVAAVSEERLNRTKLWHGIPERSVQEVLRLADITMNEVDLVAVHGEAPPAPAPEPYARKRAEIEKADLPADVRARQLAYLDQRWAHENAVLGKRTRDYLAKVQALVGNKPMRVVGHHTAHAASAYYGSGWDECIAITADGWGEDASGTVWRCRGGAMERIALTPTFESLGYFYGSITKALGFKPHRHEGKVLGLAAHCPDPLSYPRIASMVGCDLASLEFRGHMEKGLYRPNYANPALEALVADYSREDVAGAAQKRLEEVVCELVSHIPQALGKPDHSFKIAVAGGLFANVKLNQRLVELPIVEDIFVYPNMGDGGLSVGAAWLAHWQETAERPQPVESMTLGGGINGLDVLEELQREGFGVERCEDINGRIVETLMTGIPVIRVDGPMEFGPRALGNRSVLCDCSDPSVNDWLNARLQRSEFMPFAPATPVELASEYYIGADRGQRSAPFMTLTYSVTDRMKAESPAAVHVDGTARPQIVDRETYPAFHDILMRYRAEAGKANLINTSYNMHEEPIVATADDAARAFRQSGLQAMALGDYWITR